jgi:hypothetical protein
MSRNFVALAALLLGGASLTAHAEVVDVTQTDTWYQFDVDEFFDDNLGFINLDGESLSFSITVATDTLLTVVDGGFGGDRYRLFDNGVLLGTTSAGANTYPTSVGTNFDAALANANYGYGLFLLTAGSHLITGELAQSAVANAVALNASVGALKTAAASPVPLPAGGLLLLLGGGALSAFGRRRGNGIAREVQS